MLYIIKLLCFIFYEDEVEEKKTKYKTSHTPQASHQTWECGK